ncbi:ABC transporter permease [Actinotalea sp. M2MS4P-6]|uniref:ABC transporter permease n=1 Tax=Actinotalea sp. M2MS4P-6 TaxID=2983762 RepID=UPI0021E4DA59|nr:ABC transporter permease [Actinotalea sp. M2MS4P-6]MCV2394231.1 ABC transporter permease [Actinotalea sp. M2MS4P-6]
MRATTRKALRDLRRQRTQVGAVALTVALGVAMYVASAGAFRNLSTSYEGTYERLGFADVVASGTDPQALADAALGAGAAEAIVRTTADQPMTIGGTRLQGRLVGLPADAHPAVDDVDVVDGDYLSADDPDGVLLEKHAAATFDLGPGDHLQVLSPSGWHEVTVRGVVISPEYLWPAPSRQQVLGDPYGFAVVFAAEDQVRAWSGQGPTEALALLDGTDRTTVIEAVRAAGATDVLTREDNPSDAALHLDLDGFDKMSVAFPLLFLTAATVAAYVLLARRVLSERPVIGTLMAAGARRGHLIWHYVLQGLLIGLAGSATGAALGAPLTVLITKEYTTELGIPDTVVAGHPDLVVIGLALGVVVGAIGAAVPAFVAARTVPAEAMRNQVVLAGQGWWGAAVSRLRVLPATTRMALRDVVRNPRRTLATMLGSVIALVLVLASVGLMTSMITALDAQYGTIQREDAQVVVVPGTTDQVSASLDATDGVTTVEPSLVARVTVSSGDKSYATDLQGFEPGTAMHGFVDGGSDVPLPTDGVLAGARLADLLDVSVGSTLTFTDAAGATSTATLAGFVDEPLGTLVYGTRQTVSSLVADPAEVLLVQFDEGADRSALRSTITTMDDVLAYSDTRALLTMIESYLGLFWAFVGVVVVLGGVLALAVIEVTMAVNLVERTIELATLRAAGVTVRRAAGVLATENIVAIIAGLPFGLVAGFFAARGMLGLFNSDMFIIELDLGWWVLGLAALGVLLAAAASQIPAARAIRRLDVAQVVRERAA